MKIVATIEARMTSSRLPGKVLLEADGLPMLGHLIGRLKKVPSLDAIVVATTVNSQDDVLAAYAASQGVACFRGSEEDVMSRVIGAAESVQADIVVEITGDCPIIDPQVVEQTVRLFLNNPCAYASNVQVRSYPVGMDTQVFRLDTLKKSFAMTAERLDREHVSRHMRLNPDIFPQLHLVASPDMDWPELGLTLDERADYELLKKIIEYFAPNRLFGCREVIRLLEDVHPEWVELNRTVRRKGLHE